MQSQEMVYQQNRNINKETENLKKKKSKSNSGSKKYNTWNLKFKREIEKHIWACGKKNLKTGQWKLLSLRNKKKKRLKKKKWTEPRLVWHHLLNNIYIVGIPEGDKRDQKQK